jgi:hypothetical protein
MTFMLVPDVSVRVTPEMWVTCLTKVSEKLPQQHGATTLLFSAYADTVRTCFNHSSSSHVAATYIYEYIYIETHTHTHTHTLESSVLVPSFVHWPLFLYS